MSVFQVRICALVLKYNFCHESVQNWLDVLLFERDAIRQKCAVRVQQREPLLVPGWALEIPAGNGICDLLLRSVMPYTAWLNYGLLYAQIWNLAIEMCCKNMYYYLAFIKRIQNY